MNSEFKKQKKVPHSNIVNEIPSKRKVIEWTDKMIDFIFPSYNGYKFEISNESVLKKELTKILKPLSLSFPDNCKEFTSNYFKKIHTIKSNLINDAKAILDFDPAAHNLNEVIAAYPGFFAVMIYRLAHPMYIGGLYFFARIMTEYAHRETGIDIHPGAKIGNSFFIDHGTGIVIGETTEIGNNVKIYQGVTLGALNVKKDLAKTKRHPTIQDNVIIYAGATVLGGNTIIGHDTVIGGNVWLTESIQAHSIVYQKHEVHIKNGKSFDEPINYFI